MRTRLFTLFVLISSCATAQIDFKAVKTVPYVDYPDNIYAGDFDGNGQEDFVVTAGPSIIMAWYSVGEELISKQFKFTSGHAEFIRIQVGDFNDDGKDDMVLIDPAPTNSVLQKWISTGMDFEVAVVAELNDKAWDLNVVDYNGDEKLDIIILDDSEPQVYNGDGAGNFELANDAPFLPYTNIMGYFSAKDFNNDERLDVIVCSFGIVQVFLREENGQYTTSYDNREIGGNVAADIRPAIADFNGDDLVDLVMIIYENEATELKYFENDGEGGFKDPVKIETPINQLMSAQHGDYDNDGNEDLLLSSFYADHSAMVLHNLGDATFEDASPNDKIVSLFNAAFVDLDGNGTPAIVASSSDKKITIYKYDVDQYKFVEDHYIGSVLTDGVVHDLDKDGLKDVIGAGVNGVVMIWYGLEDGDFEEPVIIPFYKQVNAVAVADFNGDEIGDIAFTQISYIGDGRRGTSVLFSIGPRMYSATELSDSEAADAITTADVDGNSTMDLVTSVSVWINDGVGDFTQKDIADSESSFAFGVITGYFNDDGAIDIIITGTQKTMILLNDGDGNFPTATEIDGINVFGEMHKIDLNNDNIDDVVGLKYENGESSNIVLMTGTADGSFDITHIIEDQSLLFMAVNAADMNGDNITDIVVNYYVDDSNPQISGIGVYMGNDEGGYDDIIKFDETNGLDNVYSGNNLSLDDMDNDEKLDVVFLSLNGSPITSILQAKIEEPTETPTLTVNDILDVSASITIGKGNGNGRLLLIRKESVSAESSPSDNTVYEANASYGDGEELDPGNFAVLSSDETTITIENLEPSTTYVVTAFEYAASERSTIIDYLSTPVITSFTTTDLILGVGDDAAGSVSLSPNPASDIVMISSTQNFEGDVLIYNSIGRAFSVPVTRSSNTIQLDTSDLQKGLYIVRLKSASLKFIKQ